MPNFFLISLKDSNMLSIVISSYQPDYFSAIEKNIAKTIGIPYEIIKIDNPGKMGLSEAYNKGASETNFDFLLFLHEDVLFETQNWGRQLIELLNIENCGVIGVAGADYIPDVPVGWWMVKNYCYSHITHVNLINKTQHQYTFSGENGLKKVKFIDGVFIACSKKIWQEIKFDEWLEDYHAYDISFSLKTNLNYQNYITNLISLSHFSHGNPSKKWMEALILNRNKNKIYFNQSPINQHLEFEIYTEFSKQLWHLNFTKKEQIKHLISHLKYRKLGMYNTLRALKKIVSIIFY